MIFLSSTAIGYFPQDKFEVIRVAIVDNKVYGGSMQAMWLERLGLVIQRPRVQLQPGSLNWFASYQLGFLTMLHVFSI